MAIILPFYAFRPSKEVVHKVVSNSYETYSKEELENIKSNKPLSFLNITSEDNYDNIKQNYGNAINEGVFIKDDKPCYYLYEVNENKISRTGIIAIASTKDYGSNVIKKHEATINKRVKLFKDYLKTVKFNAEPVLIAYKDDKDFNTFIYSLKEHKTEYDFQIENINHKLWLINNENEVKHIKSYFENLNELHIADGHHRCASSSMLASEKNNERQQYLLSCLIPESNLDINSFHRVVKDINSLNFVDFFKALSKKFTIIEIENPKEKVKLNTCSFIIFANNKYFKLDLKSEFIDITNSKINTQLLFDHILKPILGFKNLKKNKRIKYIKNVNGYSDLKTLVNNSDHEIGFYANPISFKDIKEIVKQGKVLPPKSTYIKPKMKSGLIIYNI